MTDRKRSAAILAVLVGILGMAIATIGCGSKTGTDPSGVPSPKPNGTHGSSSADVNAAACTVTGASIAVKVDGRNTAGYFSESDKGVSLILQYVFLDGTNGSGDCPGPTSGDWGFGNRNDAACAYTGQRNRPFINIDCGNTGMTTVETPVQYPDGTQEQVEVDLNVS